MKFLRLVDKLNFLLDPGLLVRSMCDSILADNTNRPIQGNVAMQVTQPGGQVCNLCKWCHLMTNIRTNASDMDETKMMYLGLQSAPT